MDAGARVPVHCEAVRPNQFETLVTLGERHRAETPGFTEVSVRAALGELLRDPLIARVWFALRGRSVVGYVVMTIGCSLASGGRHAVLDTLYLVPEERSVETVAQVLEVVAGTARGLGLRRLYLREDEPAVAVAPFFAGVPFRALTRSD